MPTSELSDALNPYASQTRQRAVANNYSPPLQPIAYQPIAQPPQAPHVSELQMAITQPAPPSARSRQGAQVVAELFRRIATIQNAQEKEVQRRLAWEKEQEDKATRKAVEMEQRMAEMYEELVKLRSDYGSNPPPGAMLLTPQDTVPPDTPEQTIPNHVPVSPISPSCQPSHAGPTFIEGSSSVPLNPTDTDAVPSCSTRFSPTETVNQSSLHLLQTEDGPISESEPIPQVVNTPISSPHLVTAERPRRLPHSHSRSTKRKKRRVSYESDEADNSSSSGTSSSPPRPRKRTSHHDTTCYTIHHAIRLHIIRMMDRETDKDLPDSHIEGTTLNPSEPIRFVWDKTTKQSVHNARMKKKVLEDLKENRYLYSAVPQKEFTKKNLDAAFDQCFVTFRQKFKSQRDSATAAHFKQREESKARRARHISRRKTKLDNRSEARNKMEMFEHVIFDGALHPDCMSSEESDYEQDPLFPQPNSYLKTHGYGWRSSRLLRFYCILDDEDRIDSSAKPKRGQGRKERRVGPNKEEFILPPQGVSTWMISRHWYKASLATHPDLDRRLTKLIVDPVGFDWDNFHELGEASEVEEHTNVSLPQHIMNVYDSHMNITGTVENTTYSSSLYTNLTS